jgi:hypothetical protein
MDAAKAKALKLKAASAAKATGTVAPPAPVVPAPKKTYASLANRARGITTEKRAEMNKEKADKKAAADTKSAPAAAAASTASTASKKGKWIRRVDPSNGAIFYFNPVTEKSAWELPKGEEEDEMPGLDYHILETWLREAKSKGVLLKLNEFPFTAKALSSLSGTTVSPVSTASSNESNTGSSLSAIRAAAKAASAGVPNVAGTEESKARHSEIANAAKASVNASAGAAAAIAKARALTGPPLEIRAPRNITVAQSPPTSPGGGKRKTRKNKSKKNKSRKN